MVDAAAIGRIEPLARGRWALHSPQTGIISPYEFTYRPGRIAPGGTAPTVMLEAPVEAVGLHRTASFRLSTPKGAFAARRVVNSAGLFSDEVARLAGSGEYRIHPYRGEYLITDKDCGLGLAMPVYPVPPRDDPGLGIHITPTLEGHVILGPSAEPVGDKRDLASTREVAARLKAEAIRLMPGLARVSVHPQLHRDPAQARRSGRGGRIRGFHRRRERRPARLDRSRRHRIAGSDRGPGPGRDGGRDDRD
ncbi:MAG: FAD-dependent oxidoreductase [Ignavibacteriales bacterium]|nr:FAD-dependent oxidoreductase [Ignavibacteriales bacterium]